MINFINSPYLLLVISIFIVLISKLVFKIDYMNCFNIINNHIKIFTNTKTKKILIVPFTTHMIIPILIAVSINRIKVIDDDMINIVTVILSILTSMLFTLLVMVIDMKNKADARSADELNYSILAMKIVIKETYYSIMFEILVAVLLLVISFIYMFTQISSYVVSLIIYYLTFLLMFNLFIVLKRIFNLIDVDLNN